MASYYNEFDSKAAAWLRELIKKGLIADGEVDERSIVDVSAKDLRGYSQHHFFAGIGGWSYALRLAGWPDDKPVWTASLPCQPFSAAGKGLGKSDERHLLPHFLNLVRECRPNRIFGEQVERAIAHGWLDDLQANMEAEGYAIGHCVLGAHSIGAPHIRQRLYWVGNSASVVGQRSRERETSAESQEPLGGSGISGCGIAYPNSIGCHGWSKKSEQKKRICSRIDISGDDIQWIYCRDNKYRPIESSIKPLVDGISRGMVYSGDPCAPINANATQEARAMRLRGYGNAIVPQLAAQFIGAYMTKLVADKRNSA